MRMLFRDRLGWGGRRWGLARWTQASTEGGQSGWGKGRSRWWSAV
jgi:hypothetical protein